MGNPGLVAHVDGWVGAGRAVQHGRRPAPWDELLMFLVDADQHGPSVEAVHRLLADVGGRTVLAALGPDFEARPVAGPAAAEAAVRALPREALGFGLHADGQSHLLVARDPAGLAAEAGLGRVPLDVEVLHGPVLAGRLGVRDFERRVFYQKDLAAAVRAVDEGRAASLLLLRPARFADVAAVAEAGGTLPQKTTYFLPKPRDGLVLRPLEPAAFAGPGPVGPPDARPGATPTRPGPTGQPDPTLIGSDPTPTRPGAPDRLRAGPGGRP